MLKYNYSTLSPSTYPLPQSLPLLPSQYVEERPGLFVTLTGQVIGEHKGKTAKMANGMLYNYTLLESSIVYDYTMMCDKFFLV